MVKFSFYKMKYVGARKFVGLDNYRDIFKRDDIIGALKLCLYYMDGALIQLAIALYLATILSMKVKCSNLFKGFMFFPYLINGIAIGFIFKFFYTRGFVFDTVLQWCGFQLDNLPYWLKDANGKERDLHIEKALQVTKRVPILRKKSFEPHIVDCDYFTVDKVVLDGQRMKKIFGEIDKTSFASLLVLDGTGKVQSGEECVEVQKGDSVFITANAGEYEMEGKFEALLTTV